MLSYFMGCIALVQCVLVLRCGLAGVVWYPDAGFGLHKGTTPSQSNHTVTPVHFEPEQYSYTSANEDNSFRNHIR